ncbi:MAG TPA: IS4 family transposase [Candidatus Acidoferrum sp.]|nr:IS4 family transposase [Acetobacteraceae bacterium]HUL10443.1 IS4 family transposase [Candidatus Acidoferrum sp.]
MRFWRFLANESVTVEKLTEGWSEQTRPAASGRHVLALEDTCEIKFATTEEDRRGLGKIKKGNVFGVLLHPLLAVDADSGAVLGLAGGRVWTRQGEVTTPHARRRLAEKESGRWIAGAEEAKETLAAARLITIVGDREADFYAHWVLTPTDSVHLLTRLMNDHALVEGGTVRAAMAGLPAAAMATIELRERANRRPRKAHLSLRFASLRLKRPATTGEEGLPDSLQVNAVEVIEHNPPRDAEPVHWILLTTHAVDSVDAAWQIVEWYRQRWLIEQFFRTLKLQGLRLEDSQLATADRLLKLVAIAAKAAAIILQLVQARDGRDQRPASLTFTGREIAAIAALNARLQGNTARQKNPHPKDTLAWAAWVIAKLGGWHEYEAKPPGPITFHNGLTYFRAFAAGWTLKNV